VDHCLSFPEEKTNNGPQNTTKKNEEKTNNGPQNTTKINEEKTNNGPQDHCLSFPHLSL
jgi:hypothetical protein